MIQRDPATGNVLRVSAMDNDFCMGSSAFTLDRPPVIDTEMAAALRALTPRDIGELAGGLLEDAALDTMNERLAAMLETLDRLEQEGRVIRPDEWGGGKVWAPSCNNTATQATATACGARTFMSLKRR